MNFIYFKEKNVKIKHLMLVLKNLRCLQETNSTRTDATFKGASLVTVVFFNQPIQ